MKLPFDWRTREELSWLKLADYRCASFGAFVKFGMRGMMDKTVRDDRNFERAASLPRVETRPGRDSSHADHCRDQRVRVPCSGSVFSLTADFAGRFPRDLWNFRGLRASVRFCRAKYCGLRGLGNSSRAGTAPRTEAFLKSPGKKVANTPRNS
jgi:hypothetical protein